MSLLTRIIDKNIRPQFCTFVVQISNYSQQVQQPEETEFRVLNLKHVKGTQTVRKTFKKPEIMPPRTNQMAVDQEWGSVWPGPRSFHPATVPLPIRQGYVEKGVSPGKYGNAELMKIPNFLHLTPPVIKKQCEALKRFCTPWPKELKTDKDCQEYFPFEVVSSDYCHSSPTIRDPLARIVTLQVKVSSLCLNERAKDKLLRLVGNRYDEKTDILSIVTDRCPTKKQNYDYAMYLITAVYHESLNIEPWEETKSEADMEKYVWENSNSQKSIEAVFSWRPDGKIEPVKDVNAIPNIQQYKEAIDALMNEGESEYTANKYAESVRKLLNLSDKLT